MCGRYAFFETDQLYERFEVPKADPVFANRYNASPGTEMPIIAGGKTRQARLLRWGIIPKWAKEKAARPLINARAETVDEKPTFKKLFEKSRCLVPAMGWFEWTKTSEKQPYYFRLKNGSMFSFAGLYDDEGFLILTTDALPALKNVHHRMPVVLEREEENDWLNTGYTRAEQLKAALQVSGFLEFAKYPVSKIVNRTNHDASELIKPINLLS